jgi:DNA-binding NarL/FixJ family response regulator
MDNKISVFIVDDHPLIVEGLSNAIQNMHNITLAGYAKTAAECLQYFINHHADLILMDINLPDIKGTELCKLIKAKKPAVNIIALSNITDGNYINAIIENGASGYLLKNSDKTEIEAAINEVIKGNLYLNSEVNSIYQAAKQRQNSLPTLTKREKQILQLITTGLTNSQIAEQLFISIDTVDTHRKNLHTKLHVKNTAQLISTAIENQLISEF